jgi:anti-sigma factor RsiW
MNTHPGDDRLSELVNGTLAADERADIEAHLVACDECLAALAALRTLVDELHALPRAIMPQRDLRPGIRAQIDATAAPDAHDAGDQPAAANTSFTGAAGEHRRSDVIALRGRAQPRTLASARGWLAAAAIALIALSSTVTWLLVRQAPRDGDAVASAATAGLTAAVSEVEALEARYVLATQELEELLALQRAQLPPETRRILEENLRIIDRALDEAAAALAGQPGNPDLSRMLVATWEKKLGLLRTATALEVGI